METVKFGTFLDNGRNELTRVQYLETSKAFIFELDIDLMEALPNEVLLLPDNSPSNFHPFRVSLSKATSFPKVSDPSIRIVKGFKIAAVSTVHKPPENDQRRDFRAPVSFTIGLQSREFANMKNVQVENMSAGGLLFTSREDFEADIKVAFSLPIVNPPIRVTGIIVNTIDVHKKGIKGYGVQFTDLNAATESVIRKYIFEQQMIQIRRQREMEA